MFTRVGGKHPQVFTSDPSLEEDPAFPRAFNSWANPLGKPREHWCRTARKILFKVGGLLLISLYEGARRILIVMVTVKSRGIPRFPGALNSGLRLGDPWPQGIQTNGEEAHYNIL